MMINGKELSEPEVKAYIKELEGAVRRLSDKNAELEDNFGDLGSLYNMEVETTGFLTEQDKKLEADKMAALLLLRDAIGVLNDGSCSKDCSKCERRNNGCDYNVRFKWKHTDESLKLLRQLESK